MKFWGIFGFFFTLCYAQDILFRNDDDLEFTERNNIEPVKIPETLLIQMKDVHDISEFRNRFLPMYLLLNRTVEDTNLSTNVNSRTANTDVIGLRAPSSFAQPAICQPEEHIEELEKPENGAVMLWPSCVRVRRCGGCCTSKMLSCNPVATSSLNVTVLQVRYNPKFPNSFEDQGIRTFTLEQHDRCVCGCKERPIDCTPEVHEYRENECRCVCINQDQSQSCTGPKKIWDSRDCMCKCRYIQQCSTGRYYNIQKCKCEVLRNSLGVYGLQNYTTSRNSTIQFAQ